MPGPAVVKGILVTLTLLTTLGIAIYESPPLQAWIEDQRRRLAELLRGIGEELDPQLRREAEAFAFEGRTPATHEGLRREAEGSRGAVGRATGRETLSGTVSARRNGPGKVGEAKVKADEAAAERRRLGREYLAKRNQEMYEMQMKLKQGIKDEAEPSSPTSFDAMVDGDGRLKTPETEVDDPPLQLPEVPKEEPHSPVPVREMEQSLVQPLLAGESSDSHGWLAGSSFANPFTDEFELERSVTPKPPRVPPKVSLDEPESTDLSFPTDKRIGAIFNQNLPPVRPETERAAPTQSQTKNEELSYEEQLAIALSLSESEVSANSATVRQRNRQQGIETSDDDLRAAIEASLRDMDDQQAAHAVAYAEQDKGKAITVEKGPLVDLTPNPPVSLPETPKQDSWMRDWNASTPTQRSATFSRATSEDDELYSLTPQLTRARLASHDAWQQQAPQMPISYDPTREASSFAQPSGSNVASQKAPQVASFRSESSANEKANSASKVFASFPVSRTTSPPASTAFNGDTAPSSNVQPAVSETGTGDSQPVDLALETENLSTSQPPNSRLYTKPMETATSPPATTAYAPSSAGDEEGSWLYDSRAWNSESQTFTHEGEATDTDESIEVIDITNEDDSDVDVSESWEGRGVRTPDSWSEVGSRDGEDVDGSGSSLGGGR